MYLELIKESPLTAVLVAPIMFVHGMWHAAWCWQEVADRILNWLEFMKLK